MTTDQELLTRTADILVVDDTIASLRMLTEILTKEGYKTRPVEDPQLALEAALAQPPSLILLDVKMPKMSGFELCRRLKKDERTRDVPIIFVSALEDTEDRVQGFEVGGVDFISKPVQEAEVLARVNTHLQLRYTQLHLEELVAERTAEVVESEARYRSLVDNSLVGVFISTPDGRILFVNDALAQMHDFDSPEQMIAQGSFERWSDQKDRERMLAEIQQHGSVTNFGVETVTHTGRHIYSILSAKQLGDTLYGMATDITERVHAEQALAESEARFRATFEQAAVGIAHVAPDGSFLRLNQKFCDIVGYSHDEMLARTFQDITYPDDLETDLEHLRTLLAGEADTYAREKRYVRKSGDIVWVDLTVSLVRRATGEPDYFVSVVEDITARKQAEQALRESEEQYRTLQLEPLLELILDHLERVVDFDGGAIWLREGDHLVIRASRTRDGTSSLVGRQLFIAGNAAIHQMMETGEPSIIEDTFKQRELVQELMAVVEPLGQHYEQAGTSWLGVPVVSKDQLIGIVSLMTDQPEHYTRTTVDSVRTLVNRAAIAIENARLHQQIQQAATQEERARLGRELHDSVTQTLFSASLLADTTPRIWEKDQTMARQNLAQLGRLLRGALAEMRTLLFELRPDAIKSQTLGQLLNPLAESARARSRAMVSLNIEDDRMLPENVTTGLMRIAQESLNNVAKHAEATEVYVNLAFGSDGVVLHVTDNGRGFDPATIPPGHFGIDNMINRARKIGATFKIESESGAGTQVVVAWSEQAEESRYD